ncbi:disease resistance protein RPV1-like [Hevea brasiliensis]|nr:disease resistance protein RPV1-like [Hevea brasiliensis]
MTQVANLSGWNLQDREESEFIQDITKDVLNKLRRFSHSIAKDFVGMDSRLEKMRLCININELNNVKTVGICGMGGIGKTTIASVTYKEMQCQFEGSAFLADVRETSRKYGLFTLQRRLLCATLMERDIDVYDEYNGVYHIKNRLSRKKVLVILDDVDELEQLELLVGKKDENWFGVGSRIIITTRDEHLLIQHQVDQIYRVEELNHREALQLFCLKAFKKDCPPQDYMELSNEAVNYAGGLPLALNVLGSSLYARSVKEWNSALKRLKEIPNEKILSKLEISFDGLEEVQKKIFLDIACFFKGKMKRYVMKVLESGGLYPAIGIRELIDKSLITISDNCVWMHDLLEEMGQEIVHRECREEPGRRSRLWLYTDVCHILMNDTGTNLIEGVVLDYMFDQGERYMSSKAFLKMKALRLLIICNLNLSKDIEYLSNELRYLEWRGYPFKSLPQTFQLDQLAELHLSYSRIEQLWKGVRPLKLLKIIDLSYSKKLIKTPDFREIPYLEELILECCTGLLEVHHSIGLLERLVLLNMKNCKSLTALPSSLCNLKSLKVFILTGCSNLEELKDNIGDMTSLDVFEIAGIGSTSLPLAQPWDCLCPWWLMPKKPTPAMSFELPSLRGFCILRRLNLSHCGLTDATIPFDLSCFPFLQ